MTDKLYSIGDKCPECTGPLMFDGGQDQSWNEPGIEPALYCNGCGMSYPVDFDRLPILHTVKAWPEFYQALEAGIKPFELRRFDRTYRVGDYLGVYEFIPDPGNPNSGKYTSKRLNFRITYILSGTQIPADFGLMPGYCILGLAPVTDNLIITAQNNAFEANYLVS